jgi:hypothetical protein
MDAFDTFDAMADCPACGLPHANAASQQECLARHAARVAAPARSGFDAGLSIPLESERLGRWAVPAGLLVARLLMGVSMAQAMTRIWVSMWFHELGHAVTAWFCGFTAMPMPWVTSIGQERSWLMVAALAVAIGLLFRFGWQTEQKGIWGLAVGLWAVQAVGTLGASQPRAQLWITFGGDGGALVIGALFVLAFHLRFDEAPHWGELRWGVLGLGALSWAEVFTQWWRARTDPDSIPFGEIEGVGLSDPTKLVQLGGWEPEQVVSRYVLLGSVCLGVMLAVWAWQVWLRRADD